MNAKLALGGIGVVGIGAVSIYGGVSSKSSSSSETNEEIKNKEPVAYVLSSEQGKKLHGTDVNDEQKMANIKASDWSSINANTLDMKDALVADIPENEDWWNWNYPIFEDIKSKSVNTISTEFQAVTLAYSTDNNSSLNKVCSSAYGKSKDDFLYTTDGGKTLDPKDNKYKYFKNVWNFCRKSASVDNYEF